MYFFSLLVFCSIALTCNSINLTEICYNSKPKNTDNLIKGYKLSISGAVQQIRENGYPVEIHQISTDDGYIIDIHRIPFGLTNERRDDAAPVLILHGIGSSSAQFTIHPNNIIYKMANEGYDVWLGNFRSSSRDTRHIKYSQSQSKYWNFSLDEMALYDTPAMIEHILKTANQTQLSIISLSMSTITTTAMLAFKSELNNKVLRHVAIAPVVNLHYAAIPTFPFSLIKIIYHIQFIDNLFSVFNKLSFYLIPIICSPFGFLRLCNVGTTLFAGYSPGSYGICIGGLINNGFRGNSIKALLHFYQIISKKQLTRFDYGSKGNRARYGTEIAPIVDVSRITTPTSLIQSANDPLGSPLNVELLSRKMKTATVVLLEDRMINHIDFLIGRLDDNVINNVNRIVLENLKLP